MLNEGVVGRVTRFVTEEGVVEEMPNVGDDRSSSDDDDNSDDVDARQREEVIPEATVSVDDNAYITLVCEMNFDHDKARQALRMFDNDIERAVDFLVRES